jgi:hypothetical protein
MIKAHELRQRRFRTCGDLMFRWLRHCIDGAPVLLILTSRAKQGPADSRAPVPDTAL